MVAQLTPKRAARTAETGTSLQHKSRSLTRLKRSAAVALACKAKKPSDEGLKISML